MYICICNNLTETSLQKQIEKHKCKSMSDFVKATEFKVQCGKCCCTLKEKCSSLLPNKNPN